MWSEKETVSLPIRGFSFALTGFPIFVLIISILLGGGSLAGSAGSVSFNGQGTNTNIVDCSGFSVTNPIILPSTHSPCLTTLPVTGTITCDSPAQAHCLILNYNPGSLSYPLYLSMNVDYVIMDSGSTATFSGGQQTSSTNSIIFPFGTVGSSGLIAMIGIVVAVAGVIGLNLFGSGESPEAIHLLMMGGIFMGIWIFFSGLEGFLSNSPASFFVQLNGALPGLGTTGYFILTFVYVMSFIKSFSRGGT